MMIEKSISRPPPSYFGIDQEPEESPFLPRNVLKLFLRPGEFFSGRLALEEPVNYFIVAWIVGIAGAVGRFDQQLLRPEPKQLFVLVSKSWILFWLFVLVAGAIGSVGIWWIGGWWYHVRIRWSGCKEPDKTLARLVYIYSSLVQAGPSVLLTLIWTFYFANYYEAFGADELVSVVILIFPFWSIACSYIGVRTRFEVETWKAFIWFVILPAIVFIVAFGLIAYMLARI